jgi:hypothetical protein
MAALSMIAWAVHPFAPVVCQGDALAGSPGVASGDVDLASMRSPVDPAPPTGDTVSHLQPFFNPFESNGQPPEIP